MIIMVSFVFVLHRFHLPYTFKDEPTYLLRDAPRPNINNKTVIPISV